MKLIKQNDSAGGLIFKQNQNGKAMKQNYSFGKGFLITTTSAPYILINKSIPAGQDFTIVAFVKAIGTIGNFSNFFYANRIGGGTDTCFMVSAGSILIGNVYVGNISIRNKHFLVIRRIGTNVRVLNYTGQMVNSSEFSSTNSIENFMLRRTTSGGSAVVTKLSFFDRGLPLDEILFLYNSMLGNELLSTNGLWAEYPLERAIELEGSIVLEDNSGNNNHATFFQLPAGTNQEKVDFLNTNYFVKY